VKVADFGIAKATDMADHLTATGGILGTPSYMSPEQARGKQEDGGPIDRRSDLFSLGCILYEMIGGEKAFGGDNVTAILLKIIQEEPRPLHQLDPAVPDESSPTTSARSRGRASCRRSARPRSRRCSRRTRRRSPPPGPRGPRSRSARRRRRSDRPARLPFRRRREDRRPCPRPS
jgi:serine/threonine-protein kinase